MIKVLCSQFYSHQILLQKWWRTGLGAGGGDYKFAIYFVQVSSCYYFLFKDVVVVVDDKSLAFKPGGNNFLVY